MEGEVKQEQGYDPRAVANLFLDWAKSDGGRSGYTPMKIIKLVYIAHGWCLARLGKPLIFDPVEAWRFGPVIPRLYHAFKRFGNGAVQEPAKYEAYEKKSGQPVRGEFSEDDLRILRSVYHSYKNLKAFQLANLTHQTSSPWDKAVESSSTFIPNEAIKSEYKRLWDCKQKRAQSS